MIYSYRRVSTDEQKNGPEAQLAQIAGWISRQNLYPGFGHQDFFDNGISGSVPLAERPEGGKLVFQIEHDEDPPTIVVSKLDRLFRSVADAATTLDCWCKGDVKLVSLSEGFDMTSPYGKAMAHIMAAMAELERSMIRERTRAALRAKIARGQPGGGNPPYGKSWYQGVLIDNMREKENIHEIISSYRGGMNCAQVADALNSWDLRARNGKLWNRFMVAKIVRDNYCPPRKEVV